MIKLYIYIKYQNGQALVSTAIKNDFPFLQITPYRS